jgi:rod shape-determining protein MreC
MPYVSPRFRGFLDNLVHPYLPQMSLKLYSDSGLAEENKKLQKKLAYYESQQDYWGRLFDENEKLRELNGMPKRTAYEAHLAQVSVKNPLTGKFRFLIDKGSDQGLYKGMPVMVEDSLYGRLLEVKKDHAVVGTVAMKKIQVYCRIKGTDIFGKLSGEVSGASEGEQLCLLTWLPRDADIKPGMLIETSGFSSEKGAAEVGAGLIPGGMEVGIVKSVSRDEKFQQAHIVLSANWQSFDYVTVLKKKE